MKSSGPLHSVAGTWKSCWRVLRMAVTNTAARTMTNSDFEPELLRDLWSQLRPQLREMSSEEAEASDLLRTLINTFDPEDNEARTPMMWAYWLGNTDTGNMIGRMGENYHLEDASGRNGHWYHRNAGGGALEEDLHRTIGHQVAVNRFRSAVSQRQSEIQGAADSKGEANAGGPNDASTGH